jgi:hypothetical protein
MTYYNNKEKGIYRFPIPICKCCRDKLHLFVEVYGDFYYYSHREGDCLIYYRDKNVGP